MTDDIYQLDVPEWLDAFLKDLPKPEIPTSKYLTEVKRSALEAKIAYVEEYNMSVQSRYRKRIPEKLDIDDGIALLLHIFDFRSIATSENTENRILGVYVPSNDDIWEISSKLKDATGIYTTDEDFIKYLVTKFGITRLTDIDNVIKIVSLYSPKVARTTEAHLFPVKNGIYNQKTKQLEPFTPEYVYLSKISVDYKPNAQNPQIQEPDGSYWDVESWIRELSVSDEVNELLWQVIAASLQPNRGMNKSIWFYSDKGNNGKGTVGQLIKNLLGVGNYASIPVADFNHEFKKADLIGVAANIADENDVDQYIDSVRDYKASVTGDDIIINQKHKKPITIQFKGLNIQMMNGLPKTKDKTGSFYRRLIIVPFIKTFTDNDEKKYIKNDYIHRQEVLEYVLSKALSLEFDEFIVPSESSYLLEEYKEKNNPVLDFWNEFKEEFVWDLVPSQFLYDLYQKWFERTSPSGKMIGQRTFFEHLTPIIEADGEWENHIGKQTSNVHTGNKMDKDEPLITEYGLDKPYKNGTPSPWINQNYNGSDAEKKRDFVRKTKYRGILRI